MSSKTLMLSVILLINCFSIELIARKIDNCQYSFLNFGAVDDGITDNTASFNRAIKEASVFGGTVFVPACKYLIKGSLYLRGVSLKGENIAPRSWELLNTGAEIFCSRFWRILWQILW